MIGFGVLVVLVVIVGLVIWAVTANRAKAREGFASPPGGDATRVAASGPTRAAPTVSRRAGGLQASLDRWREAGLLTAEQAAAIGQYEAQAAPPPTRAPRRVPVVAEALGYLGGVLGTVGLVMLLGYYWHDIPDGGQIAIGAGAALMLTIAGALVPHRGEAPLERLRQFVWLAATASAGFTAGLVVDHTGTHTGTSGHALIALAAAGTVTVLSGALWRNLDRPVQQLTCLTGLAVSAGALTAVWSTVSGAGFAVWGTGIVVLCIGVLRLTPTPALTMFVGGSAAIVGAVMGPDRAWLLVGVLTAALLLALASADRPLSTVADRVVMLVVGTLGMLNTLPQALAFFSRDAGVATGLTVWAAGVAVLAMARRPFVRLQLTSQLFGGLLVVGGAALIGRESVAFATVFGLCVAVLLLVGGTLPDQAVLSVFGSLGLLVNVPWAIRHFFPGQGRAPLLIMASGVVIVCVAVWLAHEGRHLRHDLHLRHH